MCFQELRYRSTRVAYSKGHGFILSQSWRPEARTLGSAGPPSHRGSRKAHLPLPSFWDAARAVAASVQPLPPSSWASSGFIRVFSSGCLTLPLFSLVRTAITASEAHLDNPGPSLLQILNLIPSSKTLVSNKFRTWTQLFKGHHSIH